MRRYVCTVRKAPCVQHVRALAVHSSVLWRSCIALLQRLGEGKPNGIAAGHCTLYV